jgi:hypothetical protein
MLERVGEAAMWGPAENMLAATVDLLQAANWQRSGGKGSRPKPWPRPGVSDPNAKRFGNQKMTVEQWHAHKARRRHRLGGGEPLSPLN